MKLDTSRTILVVGATDRVGAAVTRSLLALDVRVKALVHPDQDVDRLPAGVQPVLGDALDLVSVQFAAAGAYAAFYVSPGGPDEEALADVFVRACATTDTRVVYVGADPGVERPLARRLRRRQLVRQLPHYRGRLAVADRILQSDTRPVVLAADHFFQDDEDFLGQLLDGRFVRPLRSRNRVDVRDVALAARRALLEPGFPSGVYPVVGPASVSGEDCASAWTAALGRSVEYAGDDRMSWQLAATGAYEGQQLWDMLATHEVLGARSARTDEREVEATTQLLGRAPTAYGAYVREVVASLQLRSP